MGFPIKYKWAEGNSNKVYNKDKATIEAGINYQGPVASNQVNGVLNYDQGALRDLQTKGGMYDNEQDYNQNNLVFVLVNEGGVVKKRTFICKADGTTGQSPLNGSTSSEHNDVKIITNEGATINSAYWDEIIVQSGVKKTISTPANYYYQITPTGFQPLGRLKIGIKKSGALKCYFEIVFAGFDNEFSIPVCNYAKDVKATTESGAVGLRTIALPGFFLGNITTTGLCLCVVKNDFCDSVEIDYTEANWIPSMNGTSNSNWDTPSSYNCTPYAIRQFGGSYIPDISVIFSSMKLRSAGSNSISYDFWKFENGFVEWNSAVMLPQGWFHQYLSGGCASLNIDVSDCVFASTGSNNGQNIGARKDGQLPNITGGWRGESGISDQWNTPLYGWRQSSSNNSQRQLYDGAFRAREEEIVSHDLYTNSVTLRSSGWKMDASLSSSVYQDAIYNVYPLRLIVNNFVRGF